MRRLAAALVAFGTCVGPALAQSAPAGSGTCVATDALDRSQRPDAGMLLVQQICRGGSRIGTAMIDVASGNAAAVSTPVKAGQTFASPATFTTPADVSLDVISANGNQQHISPSTSVFQNVGKLGEFFSVAAGNVRSFVVNRLSFYNVQSLKVVAASRGTIFDVDAKPGVSVAFSITEGRLALSRLVSIRLSDENRTVEGIRVTDTIAPTETAQIVYPVPFPIFRTFADATAAQTYFRDQLTSAQSAGDEAQIENALENIDRVGGIPAPAAIAPQSPHVEVAHAATGAFSAPVVGALGATFAVVAASVATGGFSKKSTTTANPYPVPVTQGGSVTLQSRTRPHFSLSVPFRL